MKAKKPKLLVMTSTFPRWEGDSTPPFVQLLAKNVAKGFDKVYVLAPHAKGAKTSEQDGVLRVRRYRYFFPASQQNIAYEGGGVNKIKKTPVYGLKLLSLIASQLVHTLWFAVFKKVDVINPHWIIPQGFVAVLVKFVTRKKVVLTVHGSDIFSLTGGIMTKVKRFTLKHSDVVCVNSNATKAACEAVWQRDYVVIPMGVDTEAFKPVERSKKLVKEYGLGDFTVLFVGRFAEVKGLAYLCEAFKLLHEHGYDFKALVAGDGPLKKELVSYVDAQGLASKVIFSGWVSQDELNDYYSVADVFVGPSLSEAQGIVFVEALASGTPVIATNVGGIPDIVTDGKNGLLVPPESSEDIYKVLKLMLDDRKLTRKLTDNARKSAAKKYAWDNIGTRYIEVLKGKD